MAKTVRQIKDAFPDAYTGGGLFSKFASPVWAAEFNALDLDILFITRYGEKLQSPFTEHFDKGDGVSPADVEAMARTLYSINRSAWEHLWKANIAEYNPIDNTDAYITITDTHEDSRSGTAETAGTGTVKHDTESNETTTGGGTIKHDTTENKSTAGGGTVTHTIDEDTTGKTDGTSEGSGNVDNDIYGFNSSAAVGDSKSANTTNASANSTSSGTRDVTDTENRNTTDTTTGTGSDTETRNTTDTKTGTGTDTETRNTTDKTTHAESGTGTDTHEEHRHGNIGVTTSAQMITGEIELWKWNFMDSVFSDICKYIALSIY